MTTNAEEFWDMDAPNDGKVHYSNDEGKTWHPLGYITKDWLERRGAPTHYRLPSDIEAKKAREEAAEDAEDIAAAREARKEPGRIPNYYLMPNCVEVKEIARYLTSNGGQAVQYIARATRTDGKIKGEPIRDLEKARDMINDEIARLKENN